MDVAIADSPDDQARSFCRKYMAHESLNQVQYARRLGVGQAKLSEFCGSNPQRGLTPTIARALAAYHQELRPIIHAWVNERIFSSPSGAPASTEQGAA